jgi:hypothetical protein
MPRPLDSTPSAIGQRHGAAALRHLPLAQILPGPSRTIASAAPARPTKGPA